jgi:hypothetical protein
MSTILQVFTYRPRPGQLSNFMKNVAKGSKIVHRNGGKIRLWNTANGGEAGTILLGIENANFKSYGEYAEKLEADPEWRAFVAELTREREPAAELVSSAMYVEQPVN